MPMNLQIFSTDPVISSDGILFTSTLHVQTSTPYKHTKSALVACSLEIDIIGLIDLTMKENPIASR